MRYFSGWAVRARGDIAPDERPPWPQVAVLGIQHVVAMFGSTALAPILMGFDPNIAILFSGIGTLIFFVLTAGRLPSYLGSSFAFIAVVIAASGYTGAGPNPNIPVALGGIAACGLVYAGIGFLVHFAGTRWVEVLMPPVVTGTIVAAIGLNLAPVAVKSVSGSGFATTIGLLTALLVALCAVSRFPAVRRIPILLGAIGGYIAYAVGTGVLGFGTPLDFSTVAQAAWVGMPHFVSPVFTGTAVALVVPVAVVLVAENLGHIKALSAMTGRDFDPLIGRAFIADGFATMVAAMAGGTGVTTYAENMGVMAVTKVYSTIVFVAAGAFAILLGFSPKFGALILTLPTPVIGGLALVVFGLIAATAGRIWVLNGVDFARPRNLITAAVALTAGAGDLTLHVGGFALGGIGTSTFGAILLYQLLRRDPVSPSPVAPADAAVTQRTDARASRKPAQR